MLVCDVCKGSLNSAATRGRYNVGHYEMKEPSCPPLEVCNPCWQNFIFYKTYTYPPLKVYKKLLLEWLEDNKKIINKLSKKDFWGRVKYDLTPKDVLTLFKEKVGG